MIPEWKDVAGRDPDNNNEKIAASRARTSPAPTPAGEAETLARQDERRRILLNLAIVLLPERAKVYDELEKSIATLPADGLSEEPVMSEWLVEQCCTNAARDAQKYEDLTVCVSQSANGHSAAPRRH